MGDGKEENQTPNSPMILKRTKEKYNNVCVQARPPLSQNLPSAPIQCPLLSKQLTLTTCKPIIEAMWTLSNGTNWGLGNTIKQETT